MFMRLWEFNSNEEGAVVTLCDCQQKNFLFFEAKQSSKFFVRRDDIVSQNLFINSF